MNRFYFALGTSKQSFHQYLNRKISLREECEQLLPLIREIRTEYPTMAAREMYRIVKPVRMGRDRFEKFCFDEGFKVEKRPAYHKTTNSLGVTRFENLLEGMELTAVNQVWVSDITYYRIDDTFYYLTFVTDMFSRRIIGHSVSKTLLTEDTTVPALRQALKCRGGTKPTIFHSDGGGQYYSKSFLSLTKGIRNSMGECAYDNPLAERVNGIIKNDYLTFFNPRTYYELQTQAVRAITNYNFKRQLALRHSPFQYELLSTNEHQLTKEKKKQKKKTLQQIHSFVNLSKTVNVIQA